MKHTRENRRYMHHHVQATLVMLRHSLGNRRRRETRALRTAAFNELDEVLYAALVNFHERIDLRRIHLSRQYFDKRLLGNVLCPRDLVTDRMLATVWRTCKVLDNTRLPHGYSNEAFYTPFVDRRTDVNGLSVMELRYQLTHVWNRTAHTGNAPAYKRATHQARQKLLAMQRKEHERIAGVYTWESLLSREEHYLFEQALLLNSRRVKRTNSKENA